MKIKSTFSAPLLCAVIYMLLLLSGLADALLLASDENIYLSVIVIQLVVLVIPTVFYVRLKGDAFLPRLRLRFFEADKILVILLSAALMILGSLLFSALLTAAGISNGQFSLYETFVPPGAAGLSNMLYGLVTFAALPALAEEFLFRSVILADYEPYGISSAVLMSALLFSMLHFHLPSLPVYFFCGVVLALVTYAARSVLAAMLTHFLYNLFGLFGQSFVNKVMAQLQNFEFFVVLLVLAFLLTLFLLFSEAERIYHNYAVQNKPSDYAVAKAHKKKTALFLESFLSPAFLMCLILYFIIIAGL